MATHLLLPVDLSGPDEITLNALRSLQADPDASVTLLHVIETLHDADFDEMENFYAELRSKAERVLGEWAANVKQAGYPVSCEIVYGSRVPEIVRFIEDKRISLVVLKSRAFDRNKPADTFGTLSHQIALMASCSVMLAR